MKQIKKKAICLMGGVSMLIITASADFANSTIATGTRQLIQDVMNWLVLLCPLAGAACAVVFLIRRGMADEQDGKMWNKRIVMAVCCGVGGALVSGIISMLASYY